MKIKSFIALSIAGIALSGTAHAALSVTLPPFSQTGTGGSVTGSIATSLVLGSSNDLSGDPGTNYYQATFADATTISFDWSYITNDSSGSAIYDPAGYYVNSTKYTLENRVGVTSSSGTVTELALPAGSTFKWYCNSLNNENGSAYLTVTVVPEPSAFAMLGLGALGLAARRRRNA